MAATQVGHLRCRLGGSRPSTLRHGAPARARALVAVGRRVGERGKELVMLYRCCSSGAHSTSRATPHSPATTGSRQHTWTQAVDSRAHPSPRAVDSREPTRYLEDTASAARGYNQQRIHAHTHYRPGSRPPGWPPSGNEARASVGSLQWPVGTSRSPSRRSPSKHAASTQHARSKRMHSTSGQ